MRSNRYILVSMLILTFLSSFFISTAHASWKTPSGVTVWFNITIQNNDPGNAIVQYNAINITVNALAFSAYANNGFTNFEIFNGITGNIPYQWLEGNAPTIAGSAGNELQTYGLNTVNSLEIWINMPSTIGIGVTAVNVLSIGFLSMSSNSVNGNNVGESPVLTCPTASTSTAACAYGKYDNGANVFSFYQNFTGTSTPAGWTSSGASIIQDNGLTTSGASNSYFTTANTYGLNPAQILDEFSKTTNPTGADSHIDTGYVTNTLVDTKETLVGWGLDGWGSNSMAEVYDYAASTGNTAIFEPPNGAYYLMTSYWPSMAFGAFDYNYGFQQGLYPPPPSATNIGVDIPGGGGVTTANILWMRIRTYYAQPSTDTFGPLQQPSSSWKAPSGLVEIINITINNQKQPNNALIAAGTPIEIPFNALNFTNYANGQLTNYELFNGITENILYSWLQQGNSNTYSNGLIWISLPASIAASTNAVNVISIGFAPISTTLMNGNNIGEAPELSTNYAQYDTGANVFQWYQNFEGNTLPSGWATSNTDNGNGNIIAINNGFTVNTVSSGARSSLMSDFPVSGNDVDSYIVDLYEVGTVGNASIQSIPSSTAWSAANGNYVGWYDSDANTQVFNGFTPMLSKVIGNAIGVNIILPNTITVANSLVDSGYIWNGLIEANSVNKVTILSSTYLALSVGTNGNGAKMGIAGNYIDVRTPPPNNIMPIISFGQPQMAPLSEATLTLSNTFVGEGILFTAKPIGGISPFSYNFSLFVYNAQTATNSIVANQLYTGVSLTSNSWFFQPNGNLGIGNTIFHANVAITDSLPKTVNSPLSTSLEYFPLFSSPLTETKKVITIGQSTAINSFISNGLAQYTGQFSWLSTNPLNYNVTVSSIGVGFGPTDIAINPQGTLAYVTYYGQAPGVVNVINLASDTVVNSITVQQNPVSVAFNPAGTLAFVGDACGITGNTVLCGSHLDIGLGAISVINVATNTVINTIMVGGEPFDLTVNPQGTLLYVADNCGYTTVCNHDLYGVISIINISTNTVVDTVNTLGIAPNQVAFNPSGSQAYVVNYCGLDLGCDTPYTSNGLLSIINTTNNVVINTITVGAGSVGITINPTGTIAYVVNNCGQMADCATSSYPSTVSIVNLTTDTVVNTITALEGSDSNYFGINPSGTLGYVPSGGDEGGTPNTIAIINLATGDVFQNITVGGGPLGNVLIPTAAIAFSGNVAYITNYRSRAIDVINISETELQKIPANGLLQLTVNAISSTKVSFTFNGVTYTQNVLLGNTIYGTYNVYGFANDSTLIGATPQETVSKSNTIQIVPGPAIPSCSTPSNAVADNGQYESITCSGWIGGNSPYTVNQYVFNALSYNIIAFNSISSTSSTSAIFTLQTNTLFLTPNSPLVANIVITDSNAVIVNSTQSTSFIVDSALSTPTIKPSSPITLDAGQSNTISSYESGGTGSYSYSFNVFNSISNTILANQLGSSNTFTFTTNSLWTTNSPLKANVIVTDTGASTPVAANSIKSASITIDSAMNTPTIITPTPSAQLSTNTLIWSTSFTGGTNSYTYNWIVYNTVTGNILTSTLETNSFTGNSFSWTPGTSYTGNTVNANVVVTDSATTPVTVNSVLSGTITLVSYSSPSIPTCSAPANTIVDSGQYEQISCSGWTGGTPPYTVNQYVFNALSDNIVAFNSIASTTATSAIFNFQTNTIMHLANSPLVGNVAVTDSYPTTVNSAYSTPFSVNAVLGAVSLTASNSVIDLGQGELFTYTLSGGTSPYTYNYVLQSSASTEVTNQIYTGVSATSNSFFFTIPTSMATGTATIFGNAEDSAPVPTFNTLTATFVANTAPTITLSLSNTLLDVGQDVFFTASAASGTGKENVQLYNVSNTYKQNGETNAVITTIGGSNSIMNVITSAPGTFSFAVNSYDEGTSTSYVINSVSHSATVNTAPTISLSLSNTLLDAGQYITFTAAGSSGTGKENVQLYNVSNSAKQNGQSNTLLNTIGASNTFTIQTSATGAISWVVNSYDEGTSTPYVINSISHSATVNAAPTITLLLSNTLLDAGQYITFTATGASGTGKEDMQLFNVTNSVEQNGQSNDLLNTIGASNTFTLQTGATGTISWAVNSYDEGTSSTYVANSITESASVNSALSVGLSPGTNDINIGTPQTLIATVTPGQPTYTYNFLVTNSAGYSANLLVVGNSFTSNQFKFSPSAPGTYNVNVLVTDSATSHETVASSNSVITYTNIFTTPTLTLSNTLIDQGQDILFTASTGGGLSPYTYNYLIIAYNSQSATNTIIANELYKSVVGTTNSFMWIPAGNLYIGNSIFQANVVITDSVPTTVNSVLYNFGYNAVQSTVSLTASNTLVDLGQGELFTYALSGGTSPYTYNYVLQSSTATEVTNQIYTGVSSTSNTFFFTLPTSMATGTATIFGNIEDSASTGTFNSLTSTFTSNKALGTGNIIFSNTLLDSGQTEVVTLTGIGGTYPWTIDTFNVTSGFSTNLGLPLSCNSITSASFSCHFVVSDLGGSNTFSYNALMTDSATTNEITNTISNSITVNSALSTPTISPSSASGYENGQTITIATYETGGTLPYTYNFLVFNSVTDVLIANQLGTSNSFSLTANTFMVGNTYKANVLVTDKASTPESIYSLNSGIISVYAAPTVSITATNTLVDSGQYAVFTTLVSGGSGTFGTYNFILFNSITNAVIANQLGSYTTFSVQSNSLWTTNSPLKANVIVTDTGVTTSYSFTSPNSLAVTVNSALGATISPSSATNLDAGQSITISSVPSGGTGPYTYNFTVFNSLNAVIANQIGSSSSYVFTSNSNLIGNTLEANVIVTDSAIVHTSANSVNSAGMTINPALGAATLTASNTPMVDSGLFEAFTATISGGSSPYTYNYQIFNSVTNVLIANQIYTGIVSTSNVFVWQVGGIYVGNTISANVFVTDDATTPEISNSIKITPITINEGSLSPQLALSNSFIDQGQSILFTAMPDGGSEPYTYNFLVVNVGTGAIVANQLYEGVTSGTNSFLWTPANALYTSNSFEANVVVTDAAPLTMSSPYQTIGYNAALGITISPVTNTTSLGQSQAWNAAITGGTSTFTYNWIVSNSFGIVANGLYKGLSVTYNLFSYMPLYMGNYQANIIVTDSATSQTSVTTNALLTVQSTSTSTTSTSTSSSTTTSGGGGGGTGGGGGGGGGGSSKPIITKLPNGWSITNVAQLNQFSVVLDGLLINVTENYVTPTSAGVTIGSQKYDLNLSTNYSVISTPKYNIYVQLVNISYLPIEQTIAINLYSVSTSNATINTTSKSLSINLSTSNFSFVNVSPSSLQSIVMATNAFSSTPAALSGFIKLSAFNISINTTAKSFVVITNNYPCNIPQRSIEPYLLSDGTWSEITPFFVNPTACTLTFSVSKNFSTIGIFSAPQNPTNSTTTISPTTSISSLTTTIQINSKPGSLNGLIVPLAVGLAVAAAIIIISYFIRARNKPVPKSPKT